MSTPTPDEKNGTGPGGDKASGASGATASVEDTIVTRATGDAPPRGQGAQPDAASRPAGGPPPPWQRANTREAGARPGPEPEGQGPAEPGARESGRPPADGSDADPGGAHAGDRDARPGRPGQARAAGPRPSSPPSGPLPMAGGDQRSSTAMIDAPTNQLCPLVPSFQFPRIAKDKEAQLLLPYMDEDTPEGKVEIYAIDEHYTTKHGLDQRPPPEYKMLRYEERQLQPIDNAEFNRIYQSLK